MRGLSESLTRVGTWLALALALGGAQGWAVEHYQYDAAGRLQKVTYADDSSVTYTYDNNGNLLSIISAAASGNHAPTATSASITTDENTASMGLTPQVTDPDPGDTHTFTIVTPPVHGTATVVTNQLVYTPRRDFHGSDDFMFRATDQGGLSVDGPATVTVREVGDGGLCVVATAVYGSYNAPSVRILRVFRDRWLLSSAAGRWLVQQYYTYSPPAAAWLSRHDGWRRVVRLGLWPLVGIAWLLTDASLALQCLSGTLLLGLGMRWATHVRYCRTERRTRQDTVTRCVWFWLGALAGVCVAATPATAHDFDTLHVHIRGLGRTNIFNIFDPTGCSAFIATQVANTDVATVSPEFIDAVQHTFTVTAGTDKAKIDAAGGMTTVTVSWVGEHVGGPGPCQEIASRVITIVVTDAATSTANTLSVGTAVDPVNTLTGELFDRYPPDLHLGGPLPLLFNRSYASRLKQEGIVGRLGDNWRHNFEWTLRFFGNIVEIVTDQGRIIRFEDSDTSVNEGAWSLAGVRDVPFQLVRNGAEFLCTDPRRQLVYVFEAPLASGSVGRLQRLEDGRGNVHTLTYNGTALSQVTDGLGRTLQFTYDAGGKLLTVADGTRTVEFAYAGDLLISATDPLRQTTTYAYDTAHSLTGLLTRVTLPRGTTPVTWTYDAAGRVVAQTDATGQSHTFAYDTTGSTTITDPLSQTVQHTHGSTSTLMAQERDDGLPVAIAYNNAAQRSAITDRLGDTTTHSFHTASGRLASLTNADGTTAFSYTARPMRGLTFFDLTGITYPDGTMERFVYDASGNLIERTDRGGQLWIFNYNDRGRVLTLVSPGNGTTAYTYNADQTLATAADQMGNITTLEYDALRRLTALRYPDGTSRALTYDANDNLLTDTNERGHTTTFVYDANGNLARLTDALGHTSIFTYDDLDGLVTVTDPLGQTVTRRYDALGRLAASTDRNGNVLRRDYDERGLLVALTDGTNKVWTRTYDAEGAVTSHTDPLAQTSRFVVDQLGRVQQLTSPLGHTFQVTYDAMSRIAATTDPLGETTTYAYDARGLLTGVSIPGGTVTYTRNAAGHITAVVDANGNTWRRDYDAQGRLVADIDTLGQESTYEYDSRNRVTRVRVPEGSLQMEVDAAGNVTRLLYSDGTDLRYNFDALNRMTAANGLTLAYDAVGRLTDSNGLTIGRDAGGRITSLTLAPGRTVTYTYDSRDLLTEITDWLGGTLTFTYDDAARPVSLSRPNGIITTYSYDADGRIMGITEGHLARTILTLDGRGQVATAERTVPLPATVSQTGTTELRFDAAAQVASFTYDGLGRLLSDTTRQYSWDLASRLTSYVEDNRTVRFTYDAEGHRLSRTADGSIRTYVWNYALNFPAVTVERQDGNDLRYDISTPTGMLLYSIEAGNASRRYYHFDETGNTLFLTDDTANVIASYAYTPYGVRLRTSGMIDNPFTWQGRFGVMQEGQQDLYYIRARYYDGRTARFLSRDPLLSLHPLAINPYQYARGNPQLYIDPLGLYTLSLPIVVQHGPGVGQPASEDRCPRYNCHGFTFLESQRESMDGEVEQIIADNYTQVDRAEARPGDVIVYDYGTQISHTGIIIDIDASGLVILSKENGVGDLTIHRPHHFGNAPDDSWFIFRRKKKLDDVTLGKIERRRQQFQEACQSNDRLTIQGTALSFGRFLQDLHSQLPSSPKGSGGWVVPTPGAATTTGAARCQAATPCNPTGQR